MSSYSVYGKPQNQERIYDWAQSDNIIRRKDLFFRFYLFIFRERGRGGEREGEKHQQHVVASLASSPGVLAHNPDMCPD